MSNLPQISDAEWQVMKIVWDAGPLTAGDIVRRLESEKNWRPRTIKTLLGRLVRKDAIAVQIDDRRYLYRAKISREACRREESKSFLSRVFDGAVAPALVHFIKGAKLSPREIDELKRILDQEK
ncbi:MAG: BlaI/MecI/CopY family transcriptional regulator [Bacillota bacterium]